MQSLYSFLVKFCVFGILCTLLNGCAFHLRDDYSVPDQLDTLSLTSYDQYSELTRLVAAQLRLNKIKMVSPSNSVPNLHLVSESTSSRTLSVYQNTRAAETELTLHVSYRITIPNMEQKTFSTSVTRSYLDNPLAALAKSMESAMIVTEMQKLAAQQIIRQMARLKIDFNKAEKNTKATPSSTDNTSAPSAVTHQ